MVHFYINKNGKTEISAEDAEYYAELGYEVIEERQGVPKSNPVPIKKMKVEDLIPPEKPGYKFTGWKIYRFDCEGRSAEVNDIPETAQYDEERGYAWKDYYFGNSYNLYLAYPKYEMLKTEGVGKCAGCRHYTCTRRNLGNGCRNYRKEMK